MTVGEKQELFSLLWGNFILWCASRGIRIRQRELWRTKEQAELYAAQGKGIKNSLHTIGLAIDAYFSIDGKVTFDPKDYEEAGRYWESLHPLCRAGVFFKGKVSRDAGHFSISNRGIK